ncbi:MAG: hypothetical protein ABI183_24880 [Polyangiaceae bacterium]
MKHRSSWVGASSIGGIAVVALAIAACTSSNSGTGGTGDSSSASAFISSYCSYYGSCCGTQGLPSDGNQCRELLNFEVTGVYDATSGQACLDALKSASSADAAWCVDQTASNTTNAACNGAFGKTGGNVQPGGKCSGDSDCAAAPSGDSVACHDYYNFTTSTDTRICQVETHGKAGDGPCLGTVKTSNGATETDYQDQADAGMPSQGVYCFVSEGVTCDPQTYTCLALGQVGDPCTAEQCAPGANCNTSTDTCITAKATGSACTTTTECAAGDYCDTTGTNTCTVQLNSGAACTTSPQCSSGSCSNGKCGAGLASLGLALLCGNAPDSGSN